MTHLSNQFNKKFNLGVRLFLLSILLPFIIVSCSALLPKQTIQTAYYSLDALNLNAQRNVTQMANDNLQAIIICSPKASAGFNTRHIMYSKSPHQLAYFANSEWIDTPSNMLQPMIMLAVKNTGMFSVNLPFVSKLSKSTAHFASKTLRIETQIDRLLHDFSQKPSVVHLLLRVTILEHATNKVLAQRDFIEQTNAISDNPYGGVMAANQAVNIVLQKLASFTQQTALAWRDVEKNTDKDTDSDTHTNQPLK